MTPQELKNSILQLAIQGKLVPQRAEEKINETEVIVLEEHPFEIPENWGWQTLGNCCDLYTGNSISEREKKEMYEGRKEGFDYIGTKDVLFSQEIVYDNGVKIPYKNDFKRAYNNTILLCIEGGSAGRKIAILDREVCFGNKLCAFNANKIFYKFLFYYLQSSEFKKVFIENRTGIIGGVSIKKLKNIILPIPPLAEQKRIVAKIEELLPYVERYEKAYNELQQLNKRFSGDLQKSVLQLAIQGRLVPQCPEEGNAEDLYKQIQAEKQNLIKAGKIKKEKPLPAITDDEKPFEIPQSWKWVRLGDLGFYKKGPFGSALTKSMFVSKDNRAIKVYEQKNAIKKDVKLGEYYIKREYFEEKMKGFELFAGDIIVSCAGTIGETYVMPDNFERGIINQALMKIKLFAPTYMPYFLMYFDFILKKNAKTNSKGSAIKNIPPFEILKKYLVPIPPLAEQKRIVAKLEEILPLCDKLKIK